MRFGTEKVTKDEYDRLARDKAQLLNQVATLERENKQTKYALEQAKIEATEANQLHTKVHQLQMEVESQTRTIEGLKEAVRRWRRRAGRDQELPPEPELVTAKRRPSSEGWFFQRTYTLPGVDPDPDFNKDAWAMVEQLGWKEVCGGIFFHERLQLWVAVLDSNW